MRPTRIQAETERWISGRTTLPGRLAVPGGAEVVIGSTSSLRAGNSAGPENAGFFFRRLIGYGTLQASYRLARFLRGGHH